MSVLTTFNWSTVVGTVTVNLDGCDTDVVLAAWCPIRQTDKTSQATMYSQGLSREQREAQLGGHQLPAAPMSKLRHTA